MLVFDLHLWQICGFGKKWGNIYILSNIRSTQGLWKAGDAFKQIASTSIKHVWNTCTSLGEGHGYIQTLIQLSIYVIVLSENVGISVKF